WHQLTPRRSTPELANRIFDPTCLPATVFTNPATAAPRGRTRAWRIRAKSAELWLIREIRRLSTWVLLVTLMDQTSNVEFINPSMAERIGPRSSIKDLRLAFPTWRSLPSTRTSCLRARGIRTVLPGAPMLLLTDPVAACTAHKMPATHGLASAMVCLKVIGDASEWMLREMVNAFTHSSRQRKQVCIARTMVATPGLWGTPTLVSPAAPVTSTASPSIRRTPM